jgi:hypothetical protein
VRKLITHRDLCLQTRRLTLFVKMILGKVRVRREGENTGHARVCERSGELELLSVYLKGEGGREWDWLGCLWEGSRALSASVEVKGGRADECGGLEERLGLARRDESVVEPRLGL